jgi:hypothetical protein
MKFKNLIKLCQDLKLAGEHDLADKLSCALSALAQSKRPRHDLSYSYVMRELRNKHKDKVKLFQTTFKKSFDEALFENMEDPDQVALLSALQTIDIKIE